MTLPQLRCCCHVFCSDSLFFHFFCLLLSAWKRMAVNDAVARVWRYTESRHYGAFWQHSGLVEFLKRLSGACEDPDSKLPWLKAWRADFAHWNTFWRCMMEDSVWAQGGKAGKVMEKDLSQKLAQWVRSSHALMVKLKLRTHIGIVNPETLAGFPAPPKPKPDARSVPHVQHSYSFVCC